ncbi:MAG: CRISPR-associated protein Cas4 [Armatimonadota bacterium]|nr:MAG: CRISPR-associated protein Cas4 [Armatimonadota bacterium]
MDGDWPEDELVMVSAISHWCYCPRRCALIHLEDIFEDNVFTLKGRREHEEIHEAGHEVEAGVVVQFALPLYSRRLGLSGVADVVEFWPDGRVVPVEYKHGRRYRLGKLNDMAQVCAQAMCLEEMLGVGIPSAAIYYRGSRRRQEVHLDAELRAFTEQTIFCIRQMLATACTPPPVNDRRCPDCSLIEVCQPGLIDYLQQSRGEHPLFVPREGEGLD